METLILSRREITELLSMDSCLDAMQEALIGLASRTADCPSVWSCICPRVMGFWPPCRPMTRAISIWGPS